MFGLKIGDKVIVGEARGKLMSSTPKQWLGLTGKYIGNRETPTGHYALVEIDQPLDSRIETTFHYQRLEKL